MLSPAHHSSAPASIDPTTNDCCCATNKLYPDLKNELWLPSRSVSAARRCREGGGRRLHDEAVVARFRRVVCGACHAQRWWGQKLWMFEASLGVFGGLEGFELAVWGGERW